jgi:hypothetical protein
MTAPARENISKLPDQCYTVVPGNERGKRIGIVRVGESGYYARTEPAPLWDRPLEEVEKFVDSLNAEDGVTVAQRKAMEHGSMFGWETASANPDHRINQPPEPVSVRS